MASSSSIHISTDNLQDIYDQFNGIKIGTNKNEHVELEGYPCSELNMFHGLREFSVFWYLKFDFTSEDFLNTIHRLVMSDMRIL